MKRRLASLLGAIVLVTGAVMIGCNSQSSTPTYKITLNVSKNGTVEVSPKLPQDGKVPQYTVLTFTATPNADYETEWAGAAPDAGDKNKAMLTVTANATVTATFKEKTVDSSLLQIESDGTLTGVTDKNALAGSLVIPNTVTKIGDNAFEGCTKLTSVTMADNVTEIENNAFKGCSKLTNVTIGSGVTSIKDRAFQNCTELTSLTIGKSVTKIGYGAFSECGKLTRITIPDSVTEIGDHAFEKCDALNAVTIGARVTKIGHRAFCECKKLTSITIPDKVTEIGSYAFDNCEVLTSAVFKDTSGWRVEPKDSGSPQNIDQADLEDTSKAATYLKDTYCGYTWQKQ